MSARIEVFPGLTHRMFADPEPNGDWYWRLVGGNGETVCVSEAYTRKASAKRGAKRAAWLMYGLRVSWNNIGWNPIVEVSR